MDVADDGRSLAVSSYRGGAVVGFTRAANGRPAARACRGPAAPCVADPGLLAGAGTPVALDGGGALVPAQGPRALVGLGPGLDPLTGCVADGGALGCLPPARGTLAGASAVVARGSDAYVALFDAAGVAHVRLGPGAAPAGLADCVADGGTGGCAAPPGNVLAGASAVALAGRDVYVAAFASAALVRLRREADGSLRYRGCVADRGANRCARAPVEALAGVSGLAVGAGGRLLWAVSQTGLVSLWRRDVTTGALRFAGCVGRDGRGGCAEPAARALAGASAVAVAGAQAVVAAPRSDALAVLGRDVRGRPVLVSCLAARPIRGCARGRAGALRGVSGVSARGRDVYAVAPRAGAVSWLTLPRPRGTARAAAGRPYRVRP